jgi:hypothetical protein
MRSCTIQLLAGFAVALSLVGCSSSQPPPERRSLLERLPKDGWHWVSTDRGPIAVGNGRFAIQVQAPGLDAVSAPLFLLQDRLARIPLDFGCGIRIDGIPYPRPEQEMASIQDFREGSVTFLAEGKGIAIESVWLAHPRSLVLGRRIRITAPGRRISLQTASPASPLLAQWVSPAEADLPAPALAARAARAASGTVQGDTLVAEGSLVFEECISLDGSEPPPFRQLAEESRAIWKQRWRGDIEIEGPPEDQLAVRSFLFHLYAFASPKLPPFGCTNDKYNGHRFWDAEAWILPALALFDPETAREATEWRIRTAQNQLPGWETGAGGRDATPESHRPAIHHWGWIDWWLQRAERLGIISATPAIERVRERLRDAFRGRLIETGRGYEIRGVLAPDEGRPHDNDLITNLLARRALQLTEPEVASRIVLPRAADGLFASYDQDPMKGYQQTSALLALYPLEEPLPRAEAESLFDRYKGLTSDNGPAMSHSIHATIAARLGRTEQAYQFWRRSWIPYLSPMGQFSERARSRETYFLTGAAGCLQAVLYGFAGIRVVEQEPSESPAALPLPTGAWLEIRPNLPPPWTALTLRGISAGGKRYDVRITREKVSIQPAAKAGS